MENLKQKVLLLIGVLLIVLGGFGYGYTYMADHRTVDNLSAYCDVKFQTAVDIKGKVNTANLTILDYRYGGEELKPGVTIVCDDQTFNIKAAVRQTPPSYALAYYNENTTLKNTNKLFAELPADSFEAIRKAQVIRVSFGYFNGDTIELPLSEEEMDLWKVQLQ